MKENIVSQIFSKSEIQDVSFNSKAFMLCQQIGPDQQAYLKPKKQKPELCSAAFK